MSRPAGERQVVFSGLQCGAAFSVSVVAVNSIGAGAAQTTQPRKASCVTSGGFAVVQCLIILNVHLDQWAAVSGAVEGAVAQLVHVGPHNVHSEASVASPLPLPPLPLLPLSQDLLIC